jgi:hypothetical protein
VVSGDEGGRLAGEQRREQGGGGLKLRGQGLGGQIAGAQQGVGVEARHGGHGGLLRGLGEVAGAPHDVEVGAAQKALDRQLTELRRAHDVKIGEVCDAHSWLLAPRGRKD